MDELTKLKEENKKLKSSINNSNMFISYILNKGRCMNMNVSTDYFKNRMNV